ncbi:hypothetical protein D3C85_934900 [compost metagenome]
MVDITLQHPGLARAAYTLAAAVFDIATGFEQHIEQVQSGLDVQRLAGLFQLDAVAVLGIFRRRQLGGGEAFDVGMGVAQAFAGALEGIEHRRRAAAVEVRITGLPGQVVSQVRHRVLLVVEVVEHLGIDPAELFQ